jgi:osmotically-inducible protein OsmY
MTKRLLAVVFLISGMSAPSVLLARQKGGGGDPDDRISDQVRMRLATDQDVKGGALDVTVKNGVVVIKGRVDSDKGKNKATHLAKKVKGVKEVDNELQVGPPTT